MMMSENKEVLYARAQGGDTLAQKQLAMILLRSDDTLESGIAWLRIAAQNDADAMYILAKLHLNRLNDPRQAVYWYDMAAQRGHIDAMIDIAACYLFGFQVERNVHAATEWYKRAASCGSAVAHHNLGMLALNSDGEISTALRYLQTASELGYADAAYMLGVLYIMGTTVEKNPTLALQWLIRSFELGKHYAARPIGDFYFQGAFDGGRQNLDKTVEWYMKGMECGVLSCTEALGDYYFHGFGGEVDRDLGCDFYTMAANGGSAHAAFALGTAEIENKHYRDALKWMQTAESRGHDKATKFVNMLKDVLGDGGAASAAASHSTSNAGVGGSAGINLRSSYSGISERIDAENRIKLEESKKRNESIYAAAGALSGDGSYTDYEMGAVINADGEVSYVNTELGIILGADGSTSSHDSKTGITYNFSTGDTLIYNSTLGATMDMKTGSLSYNRNGYTYQ